MQMLCSSLNQYSSDRWTPSRDMCVKNDVIAYDYEWMITQNEDNK
jgi:hypothetical protein